MNYIPKLAGPLSKKERFTKAEDDKLQELVNKYPKKDWKEIAKHFPNRTARQCRDRWSNYANPELSEEPWTQEEDDILVQLHHQIGNHWRIIQRYLPNRSKNNIKNRWSHLNNLFDDAEVKKLINNQNEQDFYSNNVATNANLLSVNSYYLQSGPQTIQIIIPAGSKIIPLNQAAYY